jgi:hypothetical protein
MSEGFVDLRLNAATQQSEETFWPSFTDIMTVIVMIFLIAMLVLLVRNMDLVSQLRASLLAEQLANEKAQSSSTKVRNLRSLLEGAESEISMLRLQLMREQEERDSLGQDLVAARQKLSAVETEKTRATLRNAELKRKLELLRENFSILQAQHALLQEKFAQLKERQKLHEDEIRSQKAQLRQAETQLSQLEGEYANLKVKYDKLVRPARTSKGKYVIEVRYSKSRGRPRIGYRKPGESGFTSISRSGLERLLGTLKAKHPKKLYVKIIFPEKSGLSFNEAWKFTDTLLKKYDYYYQEP